MTARSQITVECDAPDCAHSYTGRPGRAADSIRAELRDRGWAVAPEYHSQPDYCPEHKPEETQ